MFSNTPRMETLQDGCKSCMQQMHTEPCLYSGDLHPIKYLFISPNGSLGSLTGACWSSSMRLSIYPLHSSCPGGGGPGTAHRLLQSASRRDATVMATKIYRHRVRLVSGWKRTTDLPARCPSSDVAVLPMSLGGARWSFYDDRPFSPSRPFDCS